MTAAKKSFFGIILVLLELSAQWLCSGNPTPNKNVGSATTKLLVVFFIFYFLVLALKIKKATGCFCHNIAPPLVLAYI